MEGDTRVWTRQCGQGRRRGVKGDVHRQQRHTACRVWLLVLCEGVLLDSSKLKSRMIYKTKAQVTTQLRLGGCLFKLAPRDVMM